MKKYLTPLFVLVVALTPFSCGGYDVSPHPPVITDSDQCPAACENLRRLGCEEGQPIDVATKCGTGMDCTPGQYCESGTCHATCDQFCREMEASGVWLDPVCVSQITDCRQLNSGCPATSKK